MSSIAWCSWGAFAAASPQLAAEVRALFEQYGQGFGYLATVRPDGGPRIHPVSPVISGDGLFCFVMPSPKRHDLERDGRYALHAYPPERSDDEAYLSGRSRPVTDEVRRSRLARDHRAAAGVDWRLFEFDISIAMVTHRQRPGAPADHRTWRSAGRASLVAPEQRAGPGR